MAPAHCARSHGILLPAMNVILFRRMRRTIGADTWPGPRTPAEFGGTLTAVPRSVKDFPSRLGSGR